MPLFVSAGAAVTGAGTAVSVGDAGGGAAGVGVETGLGAEDKASRF
jgi:hypothetical protein